VLQYGILHDITILQYQYGIARCLRDCNILQYYCLMPCLHFMGVLHPPHSMPPSSWYSSTLWTFYIPCDGWMDSSLFDRCVPALGGSLQYWAVTKRTTDGPCTLVTPVSVESPINHTVVFGLPFWISQQSINENVVSSIHSTCILECIRANSKCNCVSRSFSKGKPKSALFRPQKMALFCFL
jgi:hypothetical protein